MDVGAAAGQRCNAAAPDEPRRTRDQYPLAEHSAPVPPHGPALGGSSGRHRRRAIALLRDAGAYLAQGYAIAPPMGVKDLSVWTEGRARPV